MAMYCCHHCDNYIDDDYHPGAEDPWSDMDLICPDCLEEWEEEIDNDNQHDTISIETKEKQSMYIQMDVAVQVDDVYESMSEGERVHMVNKLHKSGYLGSTLATGAISPVSLERIVEDLKAYGIPLSTIAQLYETI